jgi:hypothetical protein
VAYIRHRSEFENGITSISHAKKEILNGNLSAWRAEIEFSVGKLSLSVQQHTYCMDNWLPTMSDIETLKCYATRLVKIHKMAWNGRYFTYLQMYQKKPEQFVLPCPGSLNLISSPMSPGFINTYQEWMRYKELIPR